MLAPLLVLLAASARFSAAFVVPVQQQSSYRVPSTEELDILRLTCLTADLHCSQRPTTLYPHDSTFATDSLTISHVQPSLLSTAGLLAVLGDRAAVRLEPFASRFFPDMEDDVLVMRWLKEKFESEASHVAAGIQKEVYARQAGRLPVEVVEIMGHSEGASLALLHAVHLSRSLAPANVQIRVYLFGPTRVGNSAFASYVDRSPRLSIHLISSPSDPIPYLPSLASGYRDIPTNVRFRVDPFGDIARDVERPWGSLAHLGQKLRENLSAMRLESHLGPILGEMIWSCDEPASSKTAHTVKIPVVPAPEDTEEDRDAYAVSVGLQAFLAETAQARNLAADDVQPAFVSHGEEETSEDDS